MSWNIALKNLLPLHQYAHWISLQSESQVQQIIFLWNLPGTNLLMTIVEDVAKFLRNAFREINIYIVTVHSKIMLQKRFAVWGTYCFFFKKMHVQQQVFFCVIRHVLTVLFHYQELLVSEMCSVICWLVVWAHCFFCYKSGFQLSKGEKC